ncbi:hypothetical protein DFH07DRAFT_948273 [Mycena maculata]|uniref:Uncharacterized protein n=1 Tax=Mycena maculata TaxID=230809 RepID=A0AAD7P2Q5_9AGAR|nr:hypothetical protein DFH07DRAFT_948273 [Mycena maculata]
MKPLNTARLKGSSVENPWILDCRGNLVLPGLAWDAKENAPETRRTDMSYRPPSTIKQFPVQVLSAPAAPAVIPAAKDTGPSRPLRTTRLARQEVNSRPLAAASGSHDRRREPHTRRSQLGQRPAGVPSFGHGGFRVPRDEPLTKEDLYCDDMRPPSLPAPKPHHVCRLCKQVKSHPVSHCYVCIRMELEETWCCPSCDQVMLTPPFRHRGEEKSILYDYPTWNDESRVSYSWAGLVFPRPGAILMESEDEDARYL